MITLKTKKISKQLHKTMAIRILTQFLIDICASMNVCSHILSVATNVCMAQIPLQHCTMTCWISVTFPTEDVMTTSSDEDISALDDVIGFCNQQTMVTMKTFISPLNSTHTYWIALPLYIHLVFNWNFYTYWIFLLLYVCDMSLVLNTTYWILV